MPDWRKASDYQHTSGYSDLRWAWEFLRRNKDYRQDWDSVSARMRERSGEFTYYPKYIEQENGRPYWLLDSPTDPDDPGFYIPAIPEKDKWLLVNGLLNPATDEPKWLGFSVGWGRIILFNDLLPKHTLPLAGDRYPWAVFDLTLPLERQVESVLDNLAKLQADNGITPRRITFHRKRWPYYLRLLDAEIDCRTPAQIADHLYKEPDQDGLDARKVWDQMKAARKMTKPDGYLTIFLSTPKLKTHRYR